MKQLTRLLFVLTFTLLISLELSAECRRSSTTEPLPDDLTEVNLAKLLSFDLEVTSVSKKPEKFSDVSSAIFVITNEDIRRSGVTHVAEALRLAPGIQVARIDNQRWAISSRGFNKFFANKLLVLLDGQRIFSPQFNGVWWDQFELNLEDIDRIEVIRGPGASVWGSNAVNGVINIITCDARETIGGLASIGSGNQERLMTNVSYGESFGENSAYRVYGRFAERDNNRFETGESSFDQSSSARGGIRIDSQLTEEDQLTVRVDGFYNEKDLEVTTPSLTPPFVDSDTFSGKKEVYGANLLTNWTHSFSETSLVSTQADYTLERQDGLIFPFTRHTANLEVFHRLSPAEGHDFMYGVEYRFYSDNFQGNFGDDFQPDRRTLNFVTAYLQDEITIIEDTLKFIAGSKFEDNPFVGFQFMPTGRMVYTPNENNTFWAAVSRSVAPPSRVEDDIVVPTAAFPDPTTGLTSLVTLFGDRNFEAEKSISYEGGYRAQLLDELNIDVTFFYNDFHDLVTSEPGIPFVGSLREQATPALIIPLNFDNQHQGYSYGAEASIEWKPLDWWRFVGTYSHIDLNIIAGGSGDMVNVAFFEGSTPENQFHIRSHMDVTDDVEFDTMLRYVDRLSAGDIDAYAELDLRVAWQVHEDLEISVVGQNLLDNAHEEFEALILPPSSAVSIRRGAFAKATFTF